MTKQNEKSKAIKNLQTLRNIGPKMAEKLYRLGIKTPEQMMKSDPEELFKRLQTIDANVDPCELYVFRGAILDIPWWECKNFSKGRLHQKQGENMSILQQLQKSKGTISSALGKSLAEKVLKGDTDILKEAVELIEFSDKNVRAGASKIIEKVAEKKPDLVADYLEDLLPALKLPEPQTKWMVIHTLGLCAKLNPSVSIKAIQKAKDFIDQNSGACLWDRTILYLGYVGAISKEHTREVFPILEKTLVKIPSQTKTVLESFERMLPVLDKEMKEKVLKYTREYSTDNRPTVRSKTLKLQKILMRD